MVAKKKFFKRRRSMKKKRFMKRKTGFNRIPRPVYDKLVCNTFDVAGLLTPYAFTAQM